MSPYQQILKKISDTEKKLKLSCQEPSEIKGIELNQKNALIIQNNNENIIEEYKNLKENINVISMDNCRLAYQPVQIMSRKCPEQNY